ncbi:MAG: hypothetical protein ACYCPN_05795 [Thermoplasmata archaeon]
MEVPSPRASIPRGPRYLGERAGPEVPPRVQVSVEAGQQLLSDVPVAPPGTDRGPSPGGAPPT